jgi:hypothetical protein
MKTSGLADSPFFAAPASTSAVKPAPDLKPPETAQEPNTRLGAGKQVSNQAPMQLSKHASMQAGMQGSMIELIRKAVKGVGKESATYRFTPEEKKALLELTFTYKLQGHKTSENELTRIAINFILEDHRQNGRNSVLDQVLRALDD